MADIKINKALLKKLDIEDYRLFVMAFGKWCDLNSWEISKHDGNKSFQCLLKQYLKAMEVL